MTKATKLWKGVQQSEFKEKKILVPYFIPSLPFFPNLYDLGKLFNSSHPVSSFVKWEHS